MSNRYVEDRLISWALCKKMPPHDPSRPSESIEYRIMTLGQVCSGGLVGDGGMSRALERHRSDIMEAQRAREIEQTVRLMSRRDNDAYRVIIFAFLDVPGKIVPRRVGAAEMGISEVTWKTRYQRGLSFIDGALAVAA